MDCLNANLHNAETESIVSIRSPLSIIITNKVIECTFGMEDINKITQNANLYSKRGITKNLSNLYIITFYWMSDK